MQIRLVCCLTVRLFNGHCVFGPGPLHSVHGHARRTGAPVSLHRRGHGGARGRGLRGPRSLSMRRCDTVRAGGGIVGGKGREGPAGRRGREGDPAPLRSRKHAHGCCRGVVIVSVKCLSNGARGKLMFLLGSRVRCPERLPRGKPAMPLRRSACAGVGSPGEQG